VAVNGFDGDFPHAVTDVRDALSVDSHVPVVHCDARQRSSTKDALLTLVEHAMAMQLGRR
jgi:signal recognition particle receptor subunit beta